MTDGRQAGKVPMKVPMVPLRFFTGGSFEFSTSPKIVRASSARVEYKITRSSLIQSKAADVAGPHIFLILSLQVVSLGLRRGFVALPSRDTPRPSYILYYMAPKFG